MYPASTGDIRHAELKVHCLSGETAHLIREAEDAELRARKARLDADTAESSLRRWSEILANYLSSRESIDADNKVHFDE